jgi:3-hydroxyisobutyrate dehydrogenase-like beta-hydroxyacid dehydrogenase
MAERILGANHELVIFNRTPEKAEPLKALGAKIASSAKDALRSSECIILMLADAQAIHHVVLRNESRTELSGRTVIVIASGGEYLEAPVLGSIPETVSGGLLVLVGSSPEQFEHWSELLRCFGPEPLLIGPVGQASALKLALNQLIASLTAAFSLSLGFVQRKGIKVDESALYAPTFDKKLQRMLERDYSNPNFPTRHLAKDIDLFLSEAKGMNLQSAGLEGLDRVVKMTLDDGMSDMDYSALFNTINP